jgi:hypothetical protein
MLLLNIKTRGKIEFGLLAIEVIEGTADGCCHISYIDGEVKTVSMSNLQKAIPTTTTFIIAFLSSAHHEH